VYLARELGADLRFVLAASLVKSMYVSFRRTCLELVPVLTYSNDPVPLLVLHLSVLVPNSLTTVQIYPDIPVTYSITKKVLSMNS
jgi:hypothetical protein